MKKPAAIIVGVPTKMMPCRKMHQKVGNFPGYDGLNQHINNIGIDFC